MLGDKIRIAFLKAVKNAGGRPELAKKSGLAYSIIHRFSTGECSFANMTIGTLDKLFPEMEILFYGRSTAIRELAEAQAELEREKNKLAFEREIFLLERENWRLARENKRLKLSGKESLRKKSNSITVEKD